MGSGEQEGLVRREGSRAHGRWCCRQIQASCIDEHQPDIFSMMSHKPQSLDALLQKTEKGNRKVTELKLKMTKVTQNGKN